MDAKEVANASMKAHMPKRVSPTLCTAYPKHVRPRLRPDATLPMSSNGRRPTVSTMEMDAATPPVLHTIKRLVYRLYTSTVSSSVEPLVARATFLSTDEE